ncbi:hypothetical protein BO78DRAFT_20385 [Aspergillus sclerotiicarbonarius CBS 121057]|uniref:Uncharacterized protein n=1 Tax=Aspergillus sclerotiicarbonarius (strain CBS 121057 / IBT 28362) TaxID=1448318 RepID=A0A319DU33_ASPSB|nr:hypothetical protein BO78DRAFT_20385 [Aspergillus sclerotiicarbonarius CBS 121057]
MDDADAMAGRPHLRSSPPACSRQISIEPAELSPPFTEMPEASRHSGISCLRLPETGSVHGVSARGLPKHSGQESGERIDLVRFRMEVGYEVSEWGVRAGPSRQRPAPRIPPSCRYPIGFLAHCWFLPGDVPPSASVDKECRSMRASSSRPGTLREVGLSGRQEYGWPPKTI